MKSMYIGSGDISALLSGLNTKSYHNLLRKFVGDEKPNYNAFASPIDALRTGAILEDRYLLTLPNNYYPQYKKISKSMDALQSSLDFAEIIEGNIVNIEELKTCNFDDFLKLQTANTEGYENVIKYIKSNYKKNYNQIQQQLYTTELNEGYLVYVVVYSYDDEINNSRFINPEEILKIKITRDEEVINKIKDRAKIFQDIKDHLKVIPQQHN